MTRLRVLTYNVLQGGRRGQPLTDVVRMVAPDVLVVTEAPKRPLRWRRDCRRMATRFALRYAGGGRDAGSNLLLVRRGIEVRSVTARVLPQPRFAPRRGVVAAQLRVEGRLVGVVGCHLSLDRAGRAREVEAVLEEAARLRGPLVVAGDLNEPPDGPSWARLRSAGLVDHGSGAWPTFPADRPRSRIDAVLVRDAGVLHHGDPGVAEDLLAAASDHRPVLAVLDL